MTTTTELHLLASAVLEHAIRSDVTQGMNAYNICRFCGAQVYWNEPETEIRHDSNCAYLVAQRILKETT